MTKTRYIGLGIIGVCVFIYAVTFSFQNNSVSFGSADYGPTFFPRALAILIGVLSLILIVSERKETSSGGKTSDKIEDKIEDKIVDAGQSVEEKKASSRLVSYILGVTFLYMLIMRPIGYFISTTVYMFVSVWMLRPKRHIHFLWLLAGSAAFTFGLQYLFGTVMNVLLPPGLLK